MTKFRKFRVSWMETKSVLVLAKDDEEALRIAAKSPKFIAGGDKDFVEAEEVDDDEQD